MEEQTNDQHETAATIDETLGAINEDLDEMTARLEAGPRTPSAGTIDSLADQITAARHPKLVRHLIEQRIAEAQAEVARLQSLLLFSPDALLNCTLDQAGAIFGNGM